jgi:hypothetical protein
MRIFALALALLFLSSCAHCERAPRSVPDASHTAVADASDMTDMSDADMPDASDSDSDMISTKSCVTHLTEVETQLGLCDESLAGCQAASQSFKPMEITENYQSLPCLDDMVVKILKHDAKRNWTFLAYKVDGQEFFTDKLNLKDHPERGIIATDKIMLRFKSCSSKTCKAECLQLP